MIGQSIDSVGIVGMGAMGRGIAETAARAGLNVVLVKATPGDVEGCRKLIAGSLGRQAQRGKISLADCDATLHRIELTSDLDALARCPLIIESIVEELEPKLRLFLELEKRLSPQAVIASNTSSLPLADLAQAFKAPNRFLGLHFFSPVQAMKLVEVAPTERTYPAAVEAALALVARMDKVSVMVSPTSGYVVNRLIVPYLLDAMNALEERVAPAASIDQAMKLGCGHPMGPLELADAIGLDIVFAMAKTMHRELGDKRYSPPAMLRRLVATGQLGKKAGRGIYDYSSTPARENPDLWPAEENLVHA